VSIYLDPDATYGSANRLKAFEEGKYGPIFATRHVTQEAQWPAYTLSAASRSLTTTLDEIPRSFNQYPPQISSTPAQNDYPDSRGGSVDVDDSKDDHEPDAQ
jgi:hypothetical protein